MSRRPDCSPFAVCSVLVFAAFFAVLAQGQETVNPGAEIYSKHCASCHDKPTVRMPTRAVLEQRTSAYILKVLSAGVMKPEAAMLSAEERAAVSHWLGRTTAAGVDQAKLMNLCKAGEARPPEAAGSWTSWGGGLANLRFQPAAAAGLSAAQASRLALKWAFGVRDVTALRSQPVVYGGSLLFGGGTMVYSLDASTGCTHWATELPAAIRSGISIGAPGGRALAFFGDSAAGVHAIDVATGAPVWQMHADKHPAAIVTGTPAYYDGRLYVPVSSIEELSATAPRYVCCTFRGSVLALDATTGKTLWQTFTIDRASDEAHANKQGAPSIAPSGAGVWSAPTIDAEKKLIYVATGDNYSDPASAMSDAVVALDLETGKIAWSHQFRAGDAFNVACAIPGSTNCPDAKGPDFDFGSSPMLVERPGKHRALILAQKSGAVYAIDPDKRGKLLWQAQLGKGGSLGGIEWGTASDSERVYAAISDEALIMTTQFAPDPAQGGGMYALSLATGKQVWSAPPSPCDERRPCSPAQTAAVTTVPGLALSASLNGHVRAYSAADGKVLWDYDTGHEFKTVNGVAAHGGSISVAGPVVVGRTVYVLSGYDTFGEAPGNVLLAFSVDGK